MFKSTTIKYGTPGTATMVRGEYTSLLSMVLNAYKVFSKKRDAEVAKLKADDQRNMELLTGSLKNKFYWEDATNKALWDEYIRSIEASKVPLKWWERLFGRKREVLKQELNLWELIDSKRPGDWEAFLAERLAELPGTPYEKLMAVSSWYEPTNEVWPKRIQEVEAVIQTVQRGVNAEFTLPRSSYDSLVEVLKHVDADTVPHVSIEVGYV